MTSTNWGAQTPVSTVMTVPQITSGTRRQYNTHITYNTHVLYNGTVSRTVNATDFTPVAVSKTNWS